MSSCSDFVEDDDPCHVSIARKCKKKLIIEASPEFQIYTDSESQQVEGKLGMASNLITRLIQSSIANMISSTQNLLTPRYPTFLEVEKMSAHLRQLYPALLHDGTHVRKNSFSIL